MTLAAINDAIGKDAALSCVCRELFSDFEAKSVERKRRHSCVFE